MERRAIEARGVVQGVGFRPFVYRLAERHRIAGFVTNQDGLVQIEAEAEPSALDRFLGDLTAHPPPLASIEEVSWRPRPVRNESTFRIESSRQGGDGGAVFISPDVATCGDCLAELFNPRNRRYRYPFLNCTNCGPRLTIITGSPYDRPRTMMAGFAMCATCRTEYEDPSDRRFHAQPIACPACGPRLSLLDGEGDLIDAPDPLATFAQAIRGGWIGALKSLGGFHLCCLADEEKAVDHLRRRKRRDDKSFAVMVADLEAASTLVEIGPVERDLLESPRRPIVLLRRKGGLVEPIAAAVAPGSPWLGVMLPFTPLHHLLMHAVGGVPLIMTSGNESDEPIAYQDDAVEILGAIADLFLTHDRPIHVRCDDSVTRVVDGQELPIRRSRGDAPRPMMLSTRCARPALAVGGQLKGTFALGRDRQAFLSHHLGDLDHYEAYRAFEADVILYQNLFGIEPEVLVHDLHPDYATTRYARARADREGLATLSVQHHHAHLASCLAENAAAGPAIGDTFDGTGYGLDGAIWGGEFLVGGARGFRRAAHFRYVGMPEGEASIREPWRMAVAHLADAGAGRPRPKTLANVPLARWKMVENLLERQFQTPYTSSVGRVFDAIAVRRSWRSSPRSADSSGKRPGSAPSR